MAPKKKTGKFQSKKSVPADSAPEYVSEESTKKSSKSTVAILTTLCVFVSILACVVFLGKLGFSFTLPGKTISAGVTVAGVDIGGLTKEEAEETILSAIGDSYSTTPLVVSVLDKQLEISPSVSGANLDVEAVVRDARKLDASATGVAQMDITPYLALNTERIQQEIAAFGTNFPTTGVDTGSQIVTETVDGEEKEFLEVTIGTVYYDFSVDAVYETILNAYNHNRFSTTYTCNRMDAAAVDLDALYAQHCYDAVDAVLDPNSHEVTQSAEGYRFDLDNAKEALTTANPGDVLKFPFEVVVPGMDTETLKSMLFRDELATYTAYQSSGSNRINNLRKACESLDGLILYPGDTFGYNDTLGERTAANGYLPAAAYMNGETVQEYGGGICQPSSALYYCTLMADLEIVQRHCHTYPSSYVPFGMDATVSWGGPDFKFKNNTDFPIRIDAKADGGSVTITLVGTDLKDYYVKMEYEILGVSYPKVVEIETKNKSEHNKVKTTPYTGYSVQSYKLKYDKDTDELISRDKEAYSYYSKRDKVIYVYKEKETKPTEPTPTETKPAETTKPTEPAPTTPAPTEPKPTETKPAETTPPPATNPPETTVPPTTKPPETTAPPTTKPAETKPPVGEAGSDSQTPEE